jgi:phospho-2-dehydro-3-deoxyheptonate aldolase
MLSRRGCGTDAIPTEEWPPMQQTENLNVAALDVMPSPDEVKARVLDEPAARTVIEGRRTLEAILDRRDPRLFVVAGPCSIHDPVAGLDYARRLARSRTRSRGRSSS